MSSKAVLITDGKPFVNSDDNIINCVASIIDDDFGLRLQLKIKLQQSTLSTSESPYGSNMVHAWDPTSADFHDAFDVTLITSSSTPNSEADLIKCLTGTSESQMNLQDLSEDALGLVKAMSRPMLFNYSGLASTILVPNLSSNGLAWAHALSAELRQSNGLIFVVDADSSFFETLGDLRYMLNFPKSNRLAVFYTSASTAQKQHFEVANFYTDRYSNAEGCPGYRKCYRVRDQFTSLFEYLTFLLAASIIDQHKTVKQVKKLKDEGKKLVLLQYQPVQQDDAIDIYYGLISAPGKGEYALKTGDDFDVLFKRREAGRWHATVVETDFIGMKDKLSLLVRRPTTTTAKSSALAFQPPIIRANGLPREKVAAMVRTATGADVSIKYKGSEGSFTGLKKVCQALFDAHNMSTDHHHQKRIAEIVQGQFFGSAPVRSLWHLIKGEFPPELKADPIELMDGLNSSQEMAARMCGNLVHGLGLIFGPPGTGKTYLIIQILSLFLLSAKRNVALLAGTTNVCTDDLAKGLHSKLLSLQKEWPLLEYLPGRYVLRVHAKATELDNFRHAMRQHLSTNAQGKSTSASKECEDGQITDVFSRLVASNTAKFEGVNDKRVQEIEQSAGFQMYLIAISDPVRWASVIDLTNKFNDPKVGLTSNEQAQLDREMEVLYRMALKGATAIIGTTAGLAAPHIMEAVKDDVSVIIADEAASEREDVLLTLIGQDYSQSPAIILVGDPNQLAPRCEAGVLHNPLWPQLQKSLMTRLLDIHHDSVMLTTQYRMCPDIAEVPNVLYYRNKLINHPCTLPENRPLARDFQEYALGKINKPGLNRFMIDISVDRKHNLTVRKIPKFSKCNDYFICANANLLEELLGLYGQKGTISLITSHGAQRVAWRNVLGMMRKLKVRYLDKLTIDSIDSNQGREYDIVVVELLVDNKLGFLEDARRINVAMSRARNGLIVVCDTVRMKKTVDKAWNRARRENYFEEGAQKLAELLRMFKDRIYKRPAEGRFPACRFFTPRLPDSDELDCDW